ncbi:hypothetical protein [Reyranella soli]|uniref:Uncharacterized protein n=1 Tax=Reyranella soli TaxID=1230389 RepID=A0A512NFT3_9HYPH|nr:hypothetical protein [Reyranella soli]GEP57808.1 hypothetical protein RSO01_49740 [Reyranella soli]
MSHSVPSDSSAIDATFLIGIDLVEFDRRELPIYASPQSRWMDACHDEAPAYGAPVDRVFGEPGDVHIDGAPGNDEQLGAIAADDPLVALATLADGLAVTGREVAAPELATSFDFGADAHAVIHLHDGSGWDITGIDGTFDYLA